jgi:hypothetical protein
MATISHAEFVIHSDWVYRWVFRTKGGSLAIQDGHHRIARAAAEGRQTARVRFIDLYTPPHPTNQLNIIEGQGSPSRLCYGPVPSIKGGV